MTEHAEIRPRHDTVRRILLGVVCVQVFMVGYLTLNVPSRVSALFDGLFQIGGHATVPLLVCMLALATSVVLRSGERFGIVRLSANIRDWTDRVLSYSGRIAWMLGLLQTLLSLYSVRQVFGARMDYEAMVAQLGDVSATAYGSSLLGGGTLLAGWVAQLVLTGKVRD